jgi:glycosyltransferase involved in cell wall biosynthesis
MEAMSCGAVVITTDGAPMNELVARDRGVLVRTARAEPMRLGTSHFVDPDDLDRQIARVIAMRIEERQAIGDQARRWYRAQCAAFRAAMETFLIEIRPARPGRP